MTRLLGRAAVWVTDRERVVAEVAIWVGLLTPLALSTNGPSRTRADILTHPLAGTAAIRGAAPVFCLFLVLALIRPRVTRITRTEQALLGFLAIALASTLWSVERFDTLLRAVTLIAAYLLILMHVRIRSRNVVDTVGVLVHSLLLVAVLEALVLPGRAFVALNQYDTAPRLRGVFPDIHPDFLALFAAVAIVMMAAGRGPHWTLMPITRVLLTAVYAVTLYLTGTRTAIVVGVIGLLLVLPLRRWVRYRRAWLIAGAGVVGLILVRPSLLTALLLRHQGVGGLLTLTGRTITWGHAIAKWLQAPLLGFGYYSGHRFTIGEVTDLDNMWLTCLLDLGIIGLLIMTIFVGSAARDLWQVKDRLRWAIFTMGVVASFVNPSLEAVGYSQLLLALIILGLPNAASKANLVSGPACRDGIVGEPRLTIPKRVDRNEAASFAGATGSE